MLKNYSFELISSWFAIDSTIVLWHGRSSMKRVLSLFLIISIAALGMADGLAEPLLKVRFAGIDNLTKRDDAKTLRTIWQRKESQAFRNAALDKLAKRLGDGNAESEAALRQLLPDLG